MKGRQRVFGRISRETVALRKNENLEHNSSMIKNHKNKQNINREVNGIVNAAQTKGVSSPEGQLRTNLSATVDLRKNENLEHNSSMIKNHKTKQNINSEVNGNVNAAQTKNVVRELLHAAEQGDANAQFILGVLYRDGDGVPKDTTEAAKWFRKAADQGIADAQVHLIRLAAEQGDAAAQLKLGFKYASGNGMPQDDAEAVKWLHKAAMQGYERAKYIMNQYYNFIYTSLWASSVYF